MTDKNPDIPDNFQFDKGLFWDVPIDSLNLQTHARFIIERIVSRGTMTDWNLLKEIYGKDKIREEVVQIRSLDRKTLSFLSTYLRVEKKDFRCCS